MAFVWQSAGMPHASGQVLRQNQQQQAGQNAYSLHGHSFARGRGNGIGPGLILSSVFG